MNDLRAVAQQALDYLDAPSAKLWPAGTQHRIITALRAALAEPVQEPKPVAWRFEARHIDSAWAAAVTLKHPGPEGVYMRNVMPLYAHPPQRPAEPQEPVQEPVAQRGAMFRTHPAVELQRSVESAVRPACGVDPAAKAQPVQEPEWEVRADGKRVRTDRWQIGIRRIVALLWGNRQEFEVDEVVEAVRGLASAERTLKRLGYTDCGGEFWKPPLGAPPQRNPVEWDGRCMLGHCNSPAGCENSGECRAVERAHGIGGEE